MKFPTKLAVLFRISKKSPHDIFALFPTLPGTADPSTCTVYQDLGGHCSGDVFMLLRSSRNATEAEYADMYKNLEHIGYVFKVAKRCSAKMHALRLLAIEIDLQKKG